MRAIRQSSGSQTSGASPFCSRAIFVLSKARLSITVASLRDGQPVFVPNAGKTRRGREVEVVLLGNESNRATGNPCGVCAKVICVAEDKTSKKRTNEKIG